MKEFKTLDEAWKDYAATTQTTEAESFKAKSAFYAGAVAFVASVKYGADAMDLCQELDAFVKEMQDLHFALVLKALADDPMFLNLLLQDLIEHGPRS
jgi:hypothetical protein